MFHFNTPKCAAVALVISAALCRPSFALNPVVQSIYTADPAPLVVGDTVYLYTGHDEDKSTWFTMKDWHCYSSRDMVNWTDEGSPLSLNTFDWAKDNAWAGQCIERNGKFYWYVPIEQKTGGMVIGVAVGDTPTGPFKDALGKPLVADGFGDIDPTVFLDDDGQAYLAWGNPTYKYIRLNPDMISYDMSVGDKGVFRGPMTVEAFGKRSRTDRATAYEEGPWLYKRNELYYLVYAAGPVPEHLAYATSTKPTGPWTYQSVIMPTQGGSFTNHPGVIDFKGHSYLFYHNGALPGGGGFTRSVCIEEFNYNPDGTIPTLNMTSEGVKPLGNLDPYVRTEAETIAWESGIETQPCSQGGLCVHDIDDGDYIRVKNVDFGANGAGAFTAGVASEIPAQTAKTSSLELHLDSVNGPLVGTLPISYTGGKDSWKNETTSVSGATGMHDLFLVFKGGETGDQLNFDFWQFTKKEQAPRLTGLNASFDRDKRDVASPNNRAKPKAATMMVQVQTRSLKSAVVARGKGVQSGIAVGTLGRSAKNGLTQTALPTKDSKQGQFNYYPAQRRIKPPVSTCWTSDNGDGTFTNPVLNGDYPDPDIIRVGDDFYLVTTTFVSLPGLEVLHSKDLVNWDIASYALPTIDVDPKYSLIGGNKYGQGVWAPSLRYHDGTFYIVDNIQGTGTVVLRATTPKGPWVMNKLNGYLYDPGLMFDDDGTPLVYHGTGGDIHVAVLDADLKNVLSTAQAYKIADGEGSHAYKVGGMYYVFNSLFGEFPTLICSRSKNRTGPFETVTVCNNRTPWSSPHQGGMVQLQNGDWWGFSLVDSGAVGRTTWLGPVTWRDGWPYFGSPESPSIPKTSAKPKAGTTPIKQLPASDDFSSPRLALQWQWNHNPDDSKWSLTERPGFLRLHTQAAPDFSSARNTLTQRTEGPTCTGTIKIDTSHLKAGDRAGLGLLEEHFGYLAVAKSANGQKLVRVVNGGDLKTPSEQITDTIEGVSATTLWLRASCDFKSNTAHFSYSTDGQTFIPVGGDFPMHFTLATFQGERFGVFSYNPAGSGGWLDVDSFQRD